MTQHPLLLFTALPLSSRAGDGFSSLAIIAFSQAFSCISGQRVCPIDEWRKIKETEKNLTEIFDTSRGTNYRSVR